MGVKTEELIEVRDAALSRTRNELLQKQARIQEDLTLLAQSVEGQLPSWVPPSDVLQVAEALPERLKAFTTLLMEYTATATNKAWDLHLSVRVMKWPPNRRAQG
jgi:hypothetical protein